MTLSRRKRRRRGLRRRRGTNSDYFGTSRNEREVDGGYSMLDAMAGEVDDSDPNTFNLSSEIAFIRLAAGIASTFLFLYFAAKTETNDTFGILAFGFFFASAFLVINGFYGFWNFKKELTIGEILFPSVIILSAIFVATMDFVTVALTP